MQQDLVSGGFILRVYVCVGGVEAESCAPSIPDRTELPNMTFFRGLRGLRVQGPGSRVQGFAMY